MHNFHDMLRLTGLTLSEVERWRANGWWLEKTWDTDRFYGVDIVAIACMRRLLETNPDRPADLCALRRRAHQWLWRPEIAEHEGIKLAGVVAATRARMRRAEEAAARRSVAA